MGSIAKRIERLERLYNTEPYENPAEKEQQLARLRAKLQEVEEKAAREEAEGDPRRRIALEELKEFMKKTIADRRASEAEHGF